MQNLPDLSAAQGAEVFLKKLKVNGKIKEEYITFILTINIENMDLYFAISALLLGTGCTIIGFKVYKLKSNEASPARNRDLRYLKIFGIFAILWGLRQLWLSMV